MRHPQAILTQSVDYDKALIEGITAMPFTRYLEEVQPHLAIRRREELEKNPAYRQLLPYTIVAFGSPYDLLARANVKFALYQRTKGSGEDRLLQKKSIGFGGHIDLADVVHEASVIDLEQTILNALTRELTEEVALIDDRTGVRQESFTAVFYGLLKDNSDDVGKHHVAIINIAFLPEEDVSYHCLESSNITLARASAQEILALGDEVENWSRIFLQHWLAENPTIAALPEEDPVL